MENSSVSHWIKKQFHISPVYVELQNYWSVKRLVTVHDNFLFFSE